MNSYNLPDDLSLALFLDNEIIFSSNEKWLHPLFKLEQFLLNTDIDRSKLYLVDRISGIAAANITIYLGIKNVHALLLSKGALALYEKHNINVSYDNITDKIKCMTEQLLSDNMSISDCYKKLRQRANLTKGLELRVENLCFSYGEKKIFNNLSFVINKGDNVILEGENGAGKSTLVKIILSLLKKDSGNILFDNETSCSNIAYIKQFQDSDYFPFTVEEVIKSTTNKSKYLNCDIELALRRVGAFHLLKRIYHTLSGGEKAKVNLARALCSHSKLIIMDEVTASLDIESKKNFVEIVKSLSCVEMPTIILVNHDKYVRDNLPWARMKLEDGQIV